MVMYCMITTVFISKVTTLTLEKLQVTYRSLRRPVIAEIEIEIQSVDQKKLARVHKETMKSLGPGNPTVIVQPDESCGELPEDYEIDVENALELFETCGEIILVR